MMRIAWIVFREEIETPFGENMRWWKIPEGETGRDSGGVWFWNEGLRITVPWTSIAWIEEEERES